jgi:hypothetical protein
MPLRGKQKYAITEQQNHQDRAMNRDHYRVIMNRLQRTKNENIKQQRYIERVHKKDKVKEKTG